ncbi:MAG: glycosyltransferase [Candidatus Saganbacteria bacterium]|nr:glycosyltransferase [Candidatus Saganbacteria bacterium]
MSKPKVSVCIPVYNTEKYIGESVNSILNQSYKDFEFVIVDNCSTDATFEILESIKDPRIKLYRNDKNIGSPQNWNRCLELATSEYIALYHADDIYSPTILEEEVKLMDKHHEVGVVFAFVEYLNQSGRHYDDPKLPDIFDEINIYDFNTTLNLMMKHACFFVCPTAMFRKDIIDSVGGFDYRGYKFTFDLDMWLRIAEKSKIGLINKNLIKYRLHATQNSLNFLPVIHLEHYKTIDKYIKLANFRNWFNRNFFIYTKAKLSKQEACYLGWRKKMRDILSGAKSK